MRTSALIFTLTLIIIIGCNAEKEESPISKQEMLEIAFMHDMPHLQSGTEQELLQKYGVKSAAFVVERIKKNEIDSVTCLTYDRKGRITTRTTTECTTVGCLPYIIRQDYEYNNGSIIRMNDYTFKYKYKNVRDYWNVNDTSKFSEFDWEYYSFNGDTLEIESGSQYFKYIFNKNSQVVYKSILPKASKQKLENFFYYNDFGIEVKAKSDLSDQSSTWKYEIMSTGILKMFMKVKENKLFTRDFYFSSKGLLEKIVSLVDDEPTSIRKIYYSYY